MKMPITDVQMDDLLADAPQEVKDVWSRVRRDPAKRDLLAQGLVELIKKLKKERWAG
jgi:hypothetical protein